MRGTDHVGRIGGDEFLVLLPGCKLGAALALAERIRSRLATAVVRTGGEELAVRASLGVAGLPMAVTTVTDAVKLVSTAIHRSKQRGKNRVTVEMDTISGEIEAVELSEEDGDFEAGETMVLVQPIARLADEMPIARWIQPVGPLLAVSTMSSGPVSIASRALIERDLELLRSAVGAVAAAGDAGPFYFSILPETLRTTPPSELLEIVDAIDGRPAVGFMLADHHLVGDPSGVADAVVVLREMGMGLAMRGAGFGPQSLEAMALLRPGVVAVPVKQLLGHEPESGRLDLLLRRIRVVRSLGAEVAMEGMVDESDRALAGELGLTLGLGSGVGAVTIRRGVGTG